MPAHVLITAQYLDRCVEIGLFGVTSAQVNYLANVWPGALRKQALPRSPVGFLPVDVHPLDLLQRDGRTFT